MKLISLECPNCSAQLTVDRTLTTIQCDYCGCHFAMDEESINRIILVQKVRELIKPISDLNRLTSKLNEVYREWKELKKEEKSLLALQTWIDMFSIPLCIIVFVILLSWYGKVSLDVLGGGIWLSIFWIFIACITWDKKRKKIKKKLAKKSQQCNHIKGKINSIFKNYDIEIIPEDYRSDEQVKYIYKVLKNQRVNNIQQAVNLYEEEQHKARMEAFEEERNDLYRKQLQEWRIMNAVREEAATNSLSPKK